SIPVAPGIATAKISEAVVDATVKSDCCTPIPNVPQVEPVTPRPVARSPEKTHNGRQHPCTRHPEVALRSVGPVTGRPDVAVPWANRVVVDRESWRANSDRNNDLRRSRAWGNRDGQPQGDETNDAHPTSEKHLHTSNDLSSQGETGQGLSLPEMN